MVKRDKPYSTKPSTVRGRVRKNASRLERDVAMLYRPIEQWDIEELARGRPRNKAGNFTGPSPRWLTPLIIKQAADRLRLLTKQELSVFSGDAVRVIHKLMENEDEDEKGKPLVSAAVKLQAAQYVLDQTIGRPTVPVEVSGNVVLETLMAKVLVNEDGSPTHPVIDAEVVEDEEQEETS